MENVAEKKSSKPQAVGKKSSKGKSLMKIIQERQTSELVIAFCGPVGSGISHVVEELADCLNQAGYTHVDPLKVSDYIIKYSPSINSKEEIDAMPLGEKIEKLQDAGNELRSKYGNDILSQIIVKEIAINRQLILNPDADKAEGEIEISVEPRKHATIIDSLKHPEEVDLLKAIYGNMFYLFGILCPEQIRKNRLSGLKIPEGKVFDLMNRDKSEADGFGQKLLDTLHKSDFFIRNSGLNPESIRPTLKRYLRLILGDKHISPTVDEYAMYAAQSAALRSSCLGRQVGAALLNENGSLISTGCNEIPKFLGGYYSSEDRSKGVDGRCKSRHNYKCKNHEMKNELIEEIKNILKSNLTDEDAENITSEIAKLDKLKGLLEFCRSVHAEMDAITSAAREGGTSLIGSKLYSTTFPCHHCARHIVASGITKVYYIEPYEKSLARVLHDDSIEFDPHNENVEEIKKVVFAPFEGVAPKQYINMFQATDRKIDGVRAKADIKNSKPKVPQFLDTFLTYEKKVVRHLKDLEIFD